MGLTWRAALVSLLLFGLFVGVWHLATMGSGPTANMDPEYAKLMGTTAIWQSTDQTTGHGAAHSGKGSRRRVRQFRVGADTFPHVYGALSPAAITAAVAIDRAIGPG